MYETAAAAAKFKSANKYIHFKREIFLRIW